MAGKLDEILHCIGCMQGCVGRLIKGLDIQCLVNPLTGKEAELAIEEEEILTSAIVKKIILIRIWDKGIGNIINGELN